jgi:phosphohistidine phosphatase SixA
MSLAAACLNEGSMRLLLVIVLLLAAGAARADPAFWTAARADGTHLLMRHARAPGTGDPAGFQLGDCATQRNLDDQGREQARRIGEAIRAAGISVDLVLSSAWCRASDTAALLGLGPVVPEHSLNSFFADRSNAGRATADLTRRLAALAGRKAVLVTHQVNISALTGVYPAAGEILAITVRPDGAGVDLRGRLALP